MNRTTLLRTVAIAWVIAAIVGFGTLGQPTPAHAQVCPGLISEATTRAIRGSLTAQAAKADIIWTDLQDIVVNGTSGGHTRSAIALIAGEGSGMTGAFRIEAGLTRRRTTEGLEDVLYATCVGTHCNGMSGMAQFINHDWGLNTTYIVGITRSASASLGTFDWVVQFAQKSGSSLTNLGAIKIKASSSFPSANRLTPLGAMQRQSNSSPNSIGHTKFQRVIFRTTPTGAPLGIGSVTTAADNGYWMTRSGCAVSSYQTGTNTGCSSSGVGGGLSATCH